MVIFVFVFSKKIAFLLTHIPLQNNSIICQKGNIKYSTKLVQCVPSPLKEYIFNKFDWDNK